MAETTKKFITFENDDVHKYLSEEQRQQLVDIHLSIAKGREEDGRKAVNDYLVFNSEEQGGLVKLPFNVGDTAYVIDMAFHLAGQGGIVRCTIDEFIINNQGVYAFINGDEHFMYARRWKIVNIAVLIQTRAEAEDKLKLVIEDRKREAKNKLLLEQRKREAKDSI